MAIVINSTTGEIDLDQTAPGTYVVTYTVQGVSSTQDVTVNAVDDATFSYSASSYAPTDADPTPTITGLTGGTFSGTTGLVINSTTGEIDLSASTVAAHTVTYNTSSSGSSVCPNTSTQSVDIALAGIANNYSMSFDGSNDYLDAGSASYLNSLSQFSISVWFNLTTAASNKCIVSDWNYNTSPFGHFALQTQDASGGNYALLLFIKATSDVGVNVVKTSAILAENTWNHAVFTYNSGTVTFYINGSPVSSTIIGTIPTTLTNQDGNLIIGDFAGLSRYFNGSIDEVGIWNTALTSTQIQSIYNATSTNLTKDLTTVSGSNLVYWNRMGDN